MRSFASTLILEDIFDYLPNEESDFHNLGMSIFEPNVLIVENDCGTTLGKFETVNFEAEGLTELSTDEVLSNARITQLLSEGTYYIATRHTSTCISKDGVCLKCFQATYPDYYPTPKVLDRVTVKPEYLVNSEVVSISANINSYLLETTPDEYDKFYVYRNGIRLIQNTDFTIDSNNNVNLNVMPTQDGSIVFRFMKFDRRAFLYWLAKTYSGSLLGLEPIISNPLPLRSLFLVSALLENRLELISEQVQSIDIIPSPYRNYVNQIRDPLEKALYMLAIYCIYINVTT